MERIKKIKRNDEVVVTSGRNRGARGKVLRVFPVRQAVIVERVNMMKRHTRANPSQQVQGGIVEREAPIQVSNLKLVCPECGKPTRVGLKRLKDGSGTRECKSCGATFN